ncbi:phosphonate C-P lyase system protein PhnH [Gracilibacillus halotolerans]|uniref:phosphonate C-P lyase system protein PhnH n=1 Tax=Gracilibacillus halotolerans TaxID=74386 RepID=UPI0031D78472
MALDIVHDTQETYRKVLTSMSRPGTISTVIGDMDNPFPCHYATFLTILTLLDREVYFHVISDGENLSKVITDYTLAQETSIENADFIIVPNGTNEEAVIDAMQKCKVGTLEDPQNSSTWIIEQNMISVTGTITLTGPGIKHTTSLHLDITAELLEMRNRRVQEFPLGIDLIFTDPVSLACIPRTTKVSLDGGVI